MSVKTNHGYFDYINNFNLSFRNSFIIFYLKIRSLKNKLTELENIVEQLKTKVDIIDITETSLHPDSENITTKKALPDIFHLDNPN